VKRVLVLAAAAVVLLGCRGTGTHLVVPTPSHASYTAVNPAVVHALSAKDLWVAGDLTTTSGAPEGLILWSEDGGQRWHRAASEVNDLSNLTFSSIYFTDRLRGWLAGRRVTPEGRHRAVVFRTKDGGNHWDEVVLPARDDARIEDLHSVVFKSDSEGEVLVSFRDPKTSEVRETVYTTVDGGRAWTATAFLQEPKAKTIDRATTFFDNAKQTGFRLTRSPRVGVTALEATASGGKDWMPVSEFSLSRIPSYY
jgi:photosystem II stability/assembly factor-like uncharacterized protein